MSTTKSAFSETTCPNCLRRMYGDGSLLNDNFFHLCRESDRVMFQAMTKSGEACKRLDRHGKPCRCAYTHRDGTPCMKCGHYVQMEALNA